MSKILQAGIYGVTASANLADITSLFNQANCSVIYETVGQYKSWKPGRSVNAFTALQKYKGYTLILIQATDVDPYFADCECSQTTTTTTSGGGQQFVFRNLSDSPVHVNGVLVQPGNNHNLT
jgi:hypothetical protein